MGESIGDDTRGLISLRLCWRGDIKVVAGRQWWRLAKGVAVGGWDAC